MTKISNGFILGLILVSNAFADDEDFKPTLMWKYKVGKAVSEVRMAQESSPGSQEFGYRRIKWTLEGRYPMLASIVDITEDGTYRATYQIIGTGGKPAEDWQIVLHTGKAYENMLVSIRNPELRKAYGMKDNTCPKEVNAIWTVHESVTKKTESYCLTPMAVRVPVLPSKKNP
jgi:hypothetical protein